MPTIRYTNEIISGYLFDTPSSPAARSANSGRETNQVRIHPIVTRQIDPELLKKMGAVAEGA